MSFYIRNNVVEIAKGLLGKYLVSNVGDTLTAGRIVETEAYCGAIDKACHAYKKRTSRTEIMYKRGGCAYVFLCYGIHHLFNVVTNEEGIADAVLIRALEPVIGMDEMIRRSKKKTGERITAGPGSLTRALGIVKDDHNGLDLQSDLLWIGGMEGEPPPETETDRRIGVDYAGEDALLPWRFYIKDNEWVSKRKPRSEQKSGVA